jgi:hypothetical protein
MQCVSSDLALLHLSRDFFERSKPTTAVKTGSVMFDVGEETLLPTIPGELTL